LELSGQKRTSRPGKDTFLEGKDRRAFYEGVMWHIFGRVDTWQGGKRFCMELIDDYSLKQWEGLQSYSRGRRCAADWPRG